MRAKYLHLAETIKDELPGLIERGVLKLPSEAALMRRYTVSRQTVRRALAVLGAQGLVESRQGSGTYLCRAPGKAAREIALFISYGDDYIFPALVHDVQEALSMKGYSLNIQATGNSVLRERELLTALLQQPPVGLLAEGCKTALPNPNIDLYRALSLQGVPVVFLHGTYPALQNAVCIGQDNYGGGYLLTKYLLDKGHRRIAGIMKIDDIQGHARYDGCISALRDAALLPPDDRFFWFSTEERNRLLAEEPLTPWLCGFVRDHLADCTAVVCYNDEIAYYLIKALLAAGRQVPEDIAVVSFDNSYYATLGSIGITSLGHTQETLGKLAAAHLLKLLRGQRCSSKTLSFSLFERDSSK